jgi:peptidyl-prolyl cis-trans isomerase C
VRSLRSLLWPPSTTPPLHRRTSTTVAVSGERDSIALRSKLKDRLIALKLLRQAADELQYTNAGPAMRQATQVERTILGIQQYLRDTVRPAPVSEADIEARYRLIANSLSVLTQGRGIRAGAAAAAGANMLLERYAIGVVAGRDGATPDNTLRSERSRATLCPPVREEGNEDVSPSAAAKTPEFSVKGPPVTLISVCDGDGRRKLEALTLPQTLGFWALRDGIRRQLETERFNVAVRALVENLMAQANISE